MRNILLSMSHAFSNQLSTTNKIQICILNNSYDCNLNSSRLMFSIEDIALCLLESIVHYQNHFFLLIAIILPNRKVLEYDLRCYKIYKKIFRIHILRFNACMHQKFLQNNHILFKDTILYTYFDL